MYSFLANFHLDRLSFWLGFLAASLFWWAAVRLLGVGRLLRERVKAQLDEIARKRKAGLDERLRRETLRTVQAYHLASSMFSLEEVAVPPLVLPPYQSINLDGTIAPDEDFLRTTLPYVPDWPEINSHFSAPKLPLAQALQGGINLAVIGQPGSGKTFALAYLASQVSRRDPSVGNLTERIPIFLHTSDLRYPTDPAEIAAIDPVAVIISAISNTSPILIQSQIPGYIRQVFTKGRGLLILDGADELPLAFLKNLTGFLALLFSKYPGNQLVMAACPEYLDGLVSLGIRPVTLCSWTQLDRKKFINHWAELWQLHIEPVIARQMEREPLNSSMLNNWVLSDRSILSPLEFTLKVWSVFAGDPQGTKGYHALEAYVQRLLPDAKLRDAVSHLSLQAILAGQITFSRSHATNFININEAGITPPPIDAVPADQISPPKETSSTSTSQTPAQGELTRLVSSGLLIERQNDCLAFSHPIVMGYLASQNPINTALLNDLMAQPLWIEKNILLHYVATANDISPQIESLIRQDVSDPLMRNLLMVSRWLSDGPVNAPWRVQIMRRLVNALQRETTPHSLRARIMAAFVASNDASLPQMFHQLLGSQSPVIRQLAALGCGVVQDTKSIRELTGLLSDPVPNNRYAACMALVAMDTNQAMEPILDVLIRGDEELSRVAAEAFATQPESGYNLLKESAVFDNLLVRRASVFGLVKVGEAWAVDLLKQMQIEDSQWVVRNAANQALEQLQKSDPAVPQPLLAPHDSPWLVEFASKQGVGIIPGNPATELLIQALKTGTPEERLAAIDYLKERPAEKDLVNLFVQIVFTEDGLMSEAATYGLWILAASGAAVSLPVDLQSS